MAPETILLGVMMLGITLYALLGGADFGAGIWEFNTVLRASEKERKLIYRAIGPVWEANHVWLIFVLVGMFGAFPTAFAAISRALWIPLLLALTGIIFRAVGFAFRSYTAGAVSHQELWGAIFALASTAAPFFLGAAVGAVTSGRLPITAEGRFLGDYLTGWISPLSVYSAFFAVGACAYLAAVYLTREAHALGDTELVAIWQRRALATGLWMGVLALSGLAIMATDAPWLWQGFRARAWPMVAVSAAIGFLSLAALWLKRFMLAVFGAAGTVTTVIWGLAIAQYPVLIPPSVTMSGAKAPETVLYAMLWSVVGGAVVLVPSLVYLLHLFKGKRPVD